MSFRISMGESTALEELYEVFDLATTIVVQF